MFSIYSESVYHADTINVMITQVYFIETIQNSSFIKDLFEIIILR